MAQIKFSILKKSGVDVEASETSAKHRIAYFVEKGVVFLVFCIVRNRDYKLRDAIRLEIDGEVENIFLESLSENIESDRTESLLATLFLNYKRSLKFQYADGCLTHTLLKIEGDVCTGLSSADVRPILEWTNIGLSEGVILVGGAGKSGTTWVERVLNSHPEIFMTGENFFFLWPEQQEISTLIERQPRFAFQSMFPQFGGSSLHAWLMQSGYMATVCALYKNVAGVRYVGDKTPSYATLPHALIRGQYRYIHCIRNPFDVAISRAFHEMNIFRSHSGGEEVFSPEYGDELMRLFKQEITVDQFLRHRIVDFFDGWVHANAILRNGDADVFYVIRYEELSNCFEREIGGLFKKLEVNHDRELISNICKKNSFESYTSGRQRGDEDKTSFFRKGNPNDYLSSLSAETRMQGMEHLRRVWPENPYCNMLI